LFLLRRTQRRSSKLGEFFTRIALHLPLKGIFHDLSNRGTGLQLMQFNNPASTKIMRTLNKFIALIAVLVPVAVASDISVSEQTRVPSASPFEARAATHETWADPQAALQFPNASEVSAGIETVSSAPATRTSFMATWQNVAGATGYLLDVSTSSVFSSYVEGYHDFDVGNVTGRVLTGLNPGTTYYYRVRPYTAIGPGSYSEAMTAATVPTTGLMIHATFDGSITGHPNAAAIQAMINRAISIYESLFSDPITVQIRFRYATTAANGTPLPAGQILQGNFVYYSPSWATYIDALRADAKTSNDNLAIASLPGTPLAPTVEPASANGRALGGNTPPAMFADGTVGIGGPYDGIVTLNSAAPYQFFRPTNASNFDAQRVTEHGIGDVIGLGSRLGHSGIDLRPQDVFSWSSAGVRNLSSSGTRYFSINSGSTNIVNFNQNPSYDFGDWLSTACPQAHPYVQNAVTCTGQSSDIAATSPEGVSLDIIGYDLASSPTTDVNGDGKPDFVLHNASTRGTAVWYLNNNVYTGGAATPALPAGWTLVSAADFNRDGHPDYALFNPSTRQTVIWYFSGVTRIGSSYGPTPPGGWALVATGDFNNDGKPDYVLYKASTRQTVVWYLNNNVYIGGGVAPTLPPAWSLVGVADFDGDRRLDYLLFNPSTRQSVIWYLSGTTRIGSAAGPVIAAGYNLTGAADFDGNGKPDYVLYNPSTRGTALWYMNNNVRIGSAVGPPLPAGWSLIAP
jgi:hypothetical protein